MRKSSTNSCRPRRSHDVRSIDEYGGVRPAMPLQRGASRESNAVQGGSRLCTRRRRRVAEAENENARAPAVVRERAPIDPAAV
jgi:hypothetical protein